MQRAVVSSLLPLEELAAHEEQLLAGCAHMYASSEAGSRTSASGRGHLVEQRALAVHGRVVRERKDEFSLTRTLARTSEVIGEATVEGSFWNTSGVGIHPMVPLTPNREAEIRRLDKPGHAGDSSAAVFHLDPV